MPIGHYQQKGSASASSSSPPATGYSNPVQTLFSANLAGQMDAQYWQDQGVADEAVLTGLTTVTGETTVTSFTDGNLDYASIGTHAGMRFDNGENLGITPGQNLVGTDWTMGTVVKISASGDIAYPGQLIRPGSTNPDSEVGYFVTRLTGAWDLIGTFDLGSSDHPDVAQGAELTALLVARYEESSKDYIFNVHSIPTGVTTSQTTISIPAIRSLQFEAQPLLEIGTGGQATFWVGELFALNRKLTDAEVLTQLVPAMQTKWG